MSLRYEQYTALRRTREFLSSLIRYPTRTMTGVKLEALRCLRHFPPLTEAGEPMFSRDEFTTDTVECKDQLEGGRCARAGSDVRKDGEGRSVNGGIRVTTGTGGCNVPDRPVPDALAGDADGRVLTEPVVDGYGNGDGYGRGSDNGTGYGTGHGPGCGYGDGSGYDGRG